MEGATILRRGALCAFAILCVYAALQSNTGNSATDHIILSEVKISGQTSTDEYIELYNGSGDTIDLSGWQIEKWTRTATTTGQEKLIHTFATGTTITGNSYLLLAHSNYTLSALATPDYSYNGDESLAEDNTVFLKDTFGTITDMVGYGNATAFEGSASAISPTAAKSISRSEINGYTDTQDNASDWTRNDPSPRNSTWTPAVIQQPPVAIIIAQTQAMTSTTVVFSAASSTDSDGSIISFAWSFGDGASAEGEIVSHPYATAGIFVATLIVTDDTDLQNTSTHAITIADEEASSTPNIPHILINEIYPDPNTGEQEWIELYNDTEESILLTDWKILDAAAASSSAQTSIVSATSTILAHNFFVLYLSSSKLNNSGDTIELRNPDNTTVDIVTYGNTNLPAPDKGQSLARNASSTDTDADTDFSITTTPTTNTANIITAVNTATSTPLPVVSGGGTGITQQHITAGTIRINEIVSDPKDDEVEFVELYNTGSAPIDINNWWIEDGSEGKTVLTGTMAGFGFLVIPSPKGALNNTGDYIALFDSSSSIMDAVTYGIWTDANMSDNAPTASDPFGIIRFPDGVHNGSDALSWFVTASITKGATNIRSIASTQSAQPTPAPASWQHIRITELFPNPKGDDTHDEFIELFNMGDASIPLDNLLLKDGSESRYTIPKNTTLPAKSFLVFYRKDTKLSLNNTGGDMARLLTKDGAAIASLAYSGIAPEEESFVMDDQGNSLWTDAKTPGKTNIYSNKNNPPTPNLDISTHAQKGQRLSFDASDSTDSDGDALAFFWRFGDGRTATSAVTQHAYNKDGTFSGSLTITDSRGAIASTTFSIQVGNNGAKDVIISEIVPNPSGDDVQEFIELFNASNEDKDISGWKLDDGNGGSAPYIFPAYTTLFPLSYTAFYKSDTHISLNNDTDSARLLSPTQDVLHSVLYEQASEGASYSRTAASNYSWVKTPTPNAPNDTQTVQQKTKAVATKSTSVRGKKIIAYAPVPLAAIYQSDAGDNISTTGTVAVLPGIFGLQYFYIVGSPGVQVYMSSKQFPALAVGDVVSVHGEIGQTQGEYRVKIATATDIQIISHANPPQPYTLTTADIAEYRPGTFVSVTGEITEKRSNYFYLDDGEGEIKVIIKKNTGISLEHIAVKEMTTVSGILSATKDGTVLLPRDTHDIVILQNTSTTPEKTNPPAIYSTKNILYILSACIMLAAIIVHIRKKRAQ